MRATGVLVVCGLLQLASSSEKCDEDSLAVYKLQLNTYWTPELFPKQYPEFRPPAQWSKIIGVSHDKTFTLFRIGQEASDGFKQFSETGHADEVVARTQRKSGVFDEFNGPPISSGAGRSMTAFFVDGNHTRVSLAVHIIPSPDWFVGVDSLQLCKNGFWSESASVQTGPMDAGTDSGFTFTAPNWPTEPRQKISHISAQYPSHPANSFFYPDKEKLPTLATLHLFLDKVYRLSERRQDNLVTIDNHISTQERHDDISNDVLPSIMHDQSQRRKHRRLRKGNRRGVACKVSEWGSWSPCSVSCGMGDITRKRHVLQHPRHGGRPCPSLEENTWCGEMTACPKRFFNW